MSFITHRRLFKNELKPTMLSGYVLDLIALAVIWQVVYFSIPQLKQLSGNAVEVIVPPTAIALIGFVFFYGVRISTYVAMIRRNRSPQTIEWWCMLIGLVVPLGVWPLDDTILKAYASASGYRYCSSDSSSPIAKDVFIRQTNPCPRQ